jgi:uncharacterized protein YjbI with pentapeptide repeats
MANPEHLEILKQGVEAWNHWRKANPDVKPDLRSADLRSADLHAANLRSAYLRSANLRYANLCSANLRYANLCSAELVFADLRSTNLILADLRSADLSDANLSDANLCSADLSSANLRYANLCNTDLRYADLSDVDCSNANLRDANLSAVQAVQTNFLNVTLTGACIEDWNINAQTNFLEVECDYIYLKYDLEKGEFGDRRPGKLNQIFAPGDFEKLVKKTISTIDLIFHNGINWEAFAQSFQKLLITTGITDIDIHAIENKGDGNFIIRVNTSSITDRSEIQHFMEREYQTILRAIEEKYRVHLNAKEREIEIYRQQSVNLWEIAKLAAARPIH